MTSLARVIGDWFCNTGPTLLVVFYVIFCFHIIVFCIGVVLALVAVAVVFCGQQVLQHCWGQQVWEHCCVGVMLALVAVASNASPSESALCF